MMRFLTKCILLAFVALSLGACHKNDDEKVKARKTVIMYMAAENSLATYAKNDLREVLQAKDSIPLDCNLVVYLDDYRLPCIYTYSASTGERIWKQYNVDQNSCDTTNFINTMKEIIEDFPAENYGLVMWSHASGWIPEAPGPRMSSPKRTFGVDNNLNTTSNTGSEMSIINMRRALETLGIHWDYIFFDACFMQCVEVDYELRHLCDYIIASPAEIPGDGAPYHLVMSSLFHNKNAAKDIAERYFNYYRYNDGLIISVCKTSALDNLANVMRKHIPTLFAEKHEYEIAEDQQAYCKYGFTSTWKPEYYDMGSFMFHLLESNNTDYQEFLAAANKAYFVNLHTTRWYSIFADNYRGVIVDPFHVTSSSMFVPYTKYSQMNYVSGFHDYEWYTTTGWDQTGW